MTIYEPLEDSFLLKKHIKDYAKGKVLDLGTGSCIQAEEALKYTKDVVAADINPEAVELAKEKGIKAKVSDLFSNIKGKFDLIIFNPPYLPFDVREPQDSQLHTTGGRKGHELTEKFLSEAQKFLKKDGKILLVYSSLTYKMPSLIKQYDFMFKILEQRKFEFETISVAILSRK